MLSMRVFYTFTSAFVVAIAWMVFFVIAGNLALRFPVQDAANGSLRNGGVTTTSHGDVSTADCPNTQTQRQV
jgi:hypothetical protein